MKIIDSIVVCCSSFNDPNTWFIFRANGIEVKIILIKDEIKSDKTLTDLEIEYLNTNLK